MQRTAFTMIELLFVITVIGILSAIAIPKFAMTRNDAIITKAKSTVAALRSAIATERQKNILKGQFTDINGSTAKGLLEYGLPSDWSLSGDVFTYTAPDGSTCAFKVEHNRLDKDTSNCHVSEMDDL